MDRSMRLCPRCGKRFNWIDWPFHGAEHMSEGEKDEIRRQLRVKAEKRRTRMVQMTDERAVDMFRKLERGE